MLKLKVMDWTVIGICSTLLLMKIAFACVLLTECGDKIPWIIAIVALLAGQFVILKDYKKERHNYN